MQTSSFHVKLFPAEAADRVWAVQGRDSIEMMNVNGEYYLRSINPGHWEVSVDAISPYRDIRFDVTDMLPGTDRDLGEVRLLK